MPGFKSIAITWSTKVTQVNPELTKSNAVVIYPNPGKGVLKVLAEDVLGIEVYSISGDIILRGNMPVIEITGRLMEFTLLNKKHRKLLWLRNLSKTKEVWSLFPFSTSTPKCEIYNQMGLFC